MEHPWASTMKEAISQVCRGCTGLTFCFPPTALLPTYNLFDPPQNPRSHLCQHPTLNRDLHFYAQPLESALTGINPALLLPLQPRDQTRKTQVQAQNSPGRYARSKGAMVCHGSPCCACQARPECTLYSLWSQGGSQTLQARALV